MAGLVKIGLEIKSQSDPPVIGSVSCSPQTVSVGNSAIIFANHVNATEGINNVWAVITPPGYSTSPDIPVANLPTLDLSGSDGLYQATYGSFTIQGVYNIAVFAEDKKGFLSLPVQTTVTATGDCLPVGTDLSIPIPCIQYLGNSYGLTLGFYSNPGDAAGYYWTIVPGSFKVGQGTDCLYVGSDLSIPIPCASYNGARFGFTLDFYPNPYDPSGLYWKMDLSSFKVK